jgi:ferritin
MRKQYEEEMEHAERIIKYLQNRGEKPELKTIDAPNQNWTSFTEIFETTLNHEKKVSKMIRDLMKTAIACEDYETQNMLNWFIDEQIEEEDQATYMLERFTRITGNEAGIMVLDRECAER